MLEPVTSELLRLHPTLDDLIGLLSRLGGRPPDDTIAEVREHLALRVLFLLLGEVDSAPNYDVLRRRLEARLRIAEASALIDALAAIRAHVQSADVGPRSGLEDLTHTFRQDLFRRQGHRCAVCGWHFFNPNSPGRPETLAGPTLDHRVPHRLGGDHASNIWILCHRCNSIKRARLHVGEHGPVWTDNHVYAPRLQAVAFWVLMRDRACTIAACQHTGATARLFVARVGGQGGWVFDNCTTLCETHARGHDAINY